MKEVIRYCGIAMMTNMKSNKLSEAYYLSEELCVRISKNQREDVFRFRDQLKLRLEEGIEDIPNELLIKGEALMYMINSGQMKPEPHLKKPLSFANRSDSDKNPFEPGFNEMISKGNNS